MGASKDCFIESSFPSKHSLSLVDMDGLPDYQFTPRGARRRPGLKQA